MWSGVQKRSNININLLMEIVNYKWRSTVKLQQWLYLHIYIKYFELSLVNVTHIDKVSKGGWMKVGP